MDIQLEHKKLELIRWLASLEDISTIEKLTRFRESECPDEISDPERASIGRGILDAESGRLNPHSEVKKVYGKWV